MSAMTQLQIAWEMWKDFMKQTFGSGVSFPTSPEKMFPTAPGYVQGYSK